jgi:putative phage-type endonuclease
MSDANRFDLVTPTGMLLSDAEPLSEAWFVARRNGISATDLPQILGFSQYGNALSVWRDKRGEGMKDSDSEPAFWGRELEPVVAEVWADRNDTTVRPVGVLVNQDRPWMVASLDRLVTGVCPDYSVPEATLIGGCGLEVKTRNAYVAGKWRDDIPDDVLAQVQWGLMVTGLPHLHVACLLGGQRMETYTIGRDPELEAYLLRAATPVWDAVLEGIPPRVHADAEGVLLRELNDMFKQREGTRELPEEAWDHLFAYRDAHAKEVDATRTKKIAKGELVQMLGDGEVAEINGQKVFTYKRPKAKDELTADRLRKLHEDCPELYADMVAQGYITKTEPEPRFNLTKRSNT